MDPDCQTISKHHQVLMSRRQELTVDHTAIYVDKPTVRQLKIAFQETPVRLREIEHGWRGRRKEQMQVDTRGSGTVASSIRLLPKALPEPPREPTRAMPLTPPDTPEARCASVSSPPRNSSSKLTMSDQLQAVMPILAHPLSHTAQPLRIAPGVQVTVPSPTPTATELTIDLGGQTVRVHRDGRSIEFASHGSRRKGKQRIDLDKQEVWTPADRAQWRLVAELVEKVKRRTPRVKIFHPLAVITVTCSSPPDIIVRYRTQPDLPQPHNGATQRSDSRTTRDVRLVYSPSTQSLVINTDSRSTKHADAFRTRRIVPLHHDQPRLSVHTIQDDRIGNPASRALGLIVGNDWLRWEVEAVERFWAIRNEWQRFVDEGPSGEKG